ncbi:zinc ABC transporter solute-binding protein [Thiothrix subterranea]|uniref:zinc ABC transporter substrate-binding protein n=1 Tax=Thiothrix subterranea TaxID=2735563 RepID=UPI00192B2321|nr:zinc ABC transporter substrate-binding protein [Thiothrix subterranea]QQZ28503.1 zinc ABC transporter solute-binding protein [Thiothrix subterranea]
MLRILTIFLLLCLPVLQSCQSEPPAKPVIVSTIKPIHALVYAIAGGENSPLDIRQLLPDGASPHHYALKPSEMRTLETARVVFRIGSGLETFLDKPLATAISTREVITLADIQGIQALGARQQHGDEHAGHTAHSADSHLWLNPVNAIAMSREIARALSAVDSAHQAEYLANAQQLIAEIEATDARIRQQLAPLSQQPYLSFHDAWQHFDTHYGLNFAGAVTLDVSRLPGARHVQDIRKIIEEKQAVCLFQEPQFSPAMVKTLVEGSAIHIGELDPLGMELPLDKDTYPKLLQAAADSFQQCLGGQVAQ